MQKLRTELAHFLQDKGNDIPTTITEGDNWERFQRLLVNILSEQPIVAPSKRIGQFFYDDNGDGIIEYQTEPAKYIRHKFSQ